MAHIMDQLSQAVAEAHNYKKGYERLKEENKKLKEENEELIADIDDAVEYQFADLKLRDTLEEVNKKLEKRVEIYAQHNKKLNREMEESEKYDWEKKYHHLNTRFIALENIEKKLKEEVKDLKLDKEREYDGRCADNDENEAREKKLEEENKTLKDKTVEHLGMAETLHDEVVKENKKLKQEMDDIWNSLPSVFLAEQEETTSQGIIAEIEKLKQEIDDAVENHFADLKLRETTHKEWDTLEEENKKLQEDLLMSINTDDIAEIAGEDKEYYRDVCCAYTLGNMILENKTLKEEVNDRVVLEDGVVKENERLHEEIKTLKEHLAKKFYNHYDEMDYDKMFIAKTVGPNLENMVEHMMKQNKKLKEDNEYLHMKCETMEKDHP